MLTIALAGNPNCGKTALFNILTGIRQKTGNWPGVTVDRKEGRCEVEGMDTVVIDLPGIYSLDASSIDEEVTRNYLLSGDAQLIVNVIDASNLERNLYFTIQVLEMGVPVVVALNMVDVAKKRGIELDMELLANRLGCPVVPVVAVSGEGLDELKRQVRQVAEGAMEGGYEMVHEDSVEQAVTDIGIAIKGVEGRINRRWLALKLLEGDPGAFEFAGESVRPLVEQWRKSIEERSGEEADVHIADARYGHAHTLATQVIREKGKVGRTFSDRIDKVVLSRLIGIPIFLAVMYLMFMFTINIGGAFVDLFDQVAGALFVDGFGALLRGMGLPELVVVPLADGAGGGVQVVATFIPIVTCLFLILSILEDSGYMARAAFVMDRFMRTIGLPGKAFVPMIVGFGCNVPAVMATRTLENVRERKLTILMNPFMSCGARLPVYVLFAAAFFPDNGQNLVFGLYLIGISVALMTGLVMKRTLLSGDTTGFMMELPPYHLPTLRGVMLRTWDRVKSFIEEAGRVIIVMVLILNVLNSIGTDGSFGNQDSDKSVLSVAGQTLTPLFAPMGISQDNWPATVGIFTGIMAKEAVVGTLDSIYTQIAAEESGKDEEEAPFELLPALAAALATVPENLSGVKDLLLDPLGLGGVGEGTVEEKAEEQEVSINIFGAMASRFDGQAGAFAYLLFILLYFPCVATIGAIVKETGGPWAAFVATWTTCVAYTSASLFYQAATYARHPDSSLAWIVGLSLFVFSGLYGLRCWGTRGIETPQGTEVET